MDSPPGSPTIRKCTERVPPLPPRKDTERSRNGKGDSKFKIQDSKDKEQVKMQSAKVKRQQREVLSGRPLPNNRTR
jgi:hypothetical protein